MRDVTKAFADACLLADKATGLALVERLNEGLGGVIWDRQACLLVRLHPNTEIKVAKRLNDRGVPAYVPQERWSRKSSWNKRVVDIRPIFDGLMFVPADDRYSDLNRMRHLSDGVVGFVRFNNGAFAMARPEAMAAICRLEERLSPPMGQRKYAIGQAVMVTDGPFGLLEGEIDRLDSNGRLRVLLKMLGSQVKVDLDETQIEPV
ncbi:transcription termination/antitermination protein NusG [Tardiphaga sp. vice352]|uniref:transcription termination/antitermination protein NusG n=1 Tax=Tardiphaga sp. vice352 TaxID=2592816 RepID=UPI00143CFE6C|nr:transcription termination/antitermination NusG family protein [Tardiphaga sp. vice352]